MVRQAQQRFVRKSEARQGNWLCECGFTGYSGVCR